MFAFSLLLALGGMAAAGPDTVVVSPPAYLEALRPWVAHRAAQGHTFAFVSNAGTAVQIRDEIREQAELGGLRFVLLVGDAEPAGGTDPATRARSIPAFMAKAKVNVRWHSTPELPTDNWYADLDEDGIPDLAVGRLPVDSPQELARLVDRIIRYETEGWPGQWRQRVNLVAGMGGFGPLLDPVVEMATKKFLTTGIPSTYRTTMTYGSWRSPFCPNPYQFHDKTIQRFNEGCLFWVYIGHGYPYQLDRVHVPGGSHHILSVADMPRLQNQNGIPIAVFLACYAGAYDQPWDCLAEQMLRARGGPVAVLAGSRVTMPYGMAVLGGGLMHECFQEQTETLGEIVLNAKRQMANNSPKRTRRKLLDLLGRAVGPNPKLLHEERREHVLLFNLFGDPLTRMPYPQTIELDVAENATAGTFLEVRGKSPFPGTGTVELVSPRDKLREDPPTRHRYDNSFQSLNNFNTTYQQANDPYWARRRVLVTDHELLTALEVPVETRGPCHVRVFVQDKTGRRYAVGATDIHITSPRTASRPVRASVQDDAEAERNMSR
ncbi:MAG: C25 family cysteine peptidase [Planctomycetota bacterium]